MAKQPNSWIFLTALSISTGLGRFVPSTAIISAPAFAKSSISCKNGVIRTGLSGKSRFTIPIIGTFTVGRVAFRFSTPSMRNPAAPPITEACAIAATISGLSIGPSSTG